MIEIVKNYLLLKKQLYKLIKKSGYSDEFIASRIGIKSSYFAKENKKPIGRLKKYLK